MGVTVAALRLLAEMAGNGLFDGKPRSVVVRRFAYGPVCCKC
jgi:hypothetical protein